MSSPPSNHVSLPLRASLSKASATSPLHALTEDFVEDGPLEYPVSLEAWRDARLIVRLLQCPQCSHILKDPVTLPCGNSICKNCIPELQARQNISYPGSPERILGFPCPLGDCTIVHASGDCNLDVALTKNLNKFRRVFEKYKTLPEASQILLKLELQNEWQISGVPRLGECTSRVLPGGRLMATYNMAEIGDLPYNAEVGYQSLSGISDTSSQMDLVIMDHLREAARSELDCQVCYGIFLDPFTTPCGHTFCRNCLKQVLSHSNLCPLCRRTQAIPPEHRPQDAPSNLVLSKIISGICSDALASRFELAELETVDEIQPDVPLFVCTIAFPKMPTFLHVFEPRYRLMLGRALETSNREFGMLLHNPSKEPQGDLGRVHFYEYGTMLQIRNVQLLPDGRSVVETYGTSRFRVRSHGNLDGYTTGKVTRVDDLSMAGEEAFEARDRTSVTLQRCHSSAEEQHFATPSTHTTNSDFANLLEELDSMSTMALYELCASFVKRMREQSRTWLHYRVFQVYGECPQDPSVFPWWFASVAPATDQQKYRLLSTTTVRERLKISAEWVLEFEAQRLDHSRSEGSNCAVL